MIDKLIEVSETNPSIQQSLNKVITTLQRNLKTEFDYLKVFTNRNSEYTGMAKQYINAFTKRLGLDI